MSPDLGTLLNDLAFAGARVVEAREALVSGEHQRKGEKLPGFEARRAVEEAALSAAVARREDLLNQAQVRAAVESVRGLKGRDPVPCEDVLECLTSRQAKQLESARRTSLLAKRRLCALKADRVALAREIEALRRQIRHCLMSEMDRAVRLARQRDRKLEQRRDVLLEIWVWKDKYNKACAVLRRLGVTVGGGEGKGS